MKRSIGWSAEYDAGDAKEVVTLSIVERENGSFYIAQDGEVPGDSRGLSKAQAVAKIAEDCGTLYNYVRFVQEERTLERGR